MIKPHLLASLLIAFTSFISSAQTWKSRSSTPLLPTAVNNFFELGKDTFLMCGNSISRSVDGGNSWNDATDKQTARVWEKTYFVDHTTGYTVPTPSLPAIIAKTGNGGENWTITNLPTNYPAFSLFFINKDTGYYGSSSRIFRTYNGGTTWSSSSTTYSGTINAIHFINNDTGYAASSNGYIYTTINKGTSWSLSLSATSNTVFNRIYFLNSDTGWAIANNRTYVTYNKGNDWNTLHSTIGFTDLYFLNKDTGFYRNGDTLFITTNFGTTWNTLVTLPASNRGVSFTQQNGNLYLTNGYLTLRSNNKGTSWDTLTNYPNYFGSSAINHGVMPTKSTGWLVGTNGGIYRTTDSATTWQQQTIVSQKNLLKVFALNKDTAWVAGDGIFLRTYNGGQTWDSVSGRTGTPSALWFINKDTGYMNISGIFRTMNGGASWSSVSMPSSTIPTYYSIYFINQDTGFITGYDGHFYKTVNKGFSWRKITSSAYNSASPSAVLLLDSSLYLTTGTNVASSKNYGETWSVRSTGSPYFADFNGITRHTLFGLNYSNTLFGNLYKSNDQCSTWVSINSPNIANSFRNILSTDSNLITLVSTHDGIVEASNNWVEIPELDSMSMDTFTANDSLLFKVYGKNLNASSQIITSLAGTSYTVNYVSPNELDVKLKRSTYFTVGNHTIRIFNSTGAIGSTSSLTFTVIDTLPQTPSSNVSIIVTDSSRITFSYQQGSGTRQLIIFRKDAPVNVFPAINSAYSSSRTYGTASTHIGDSNFVIYNTTYQTSPLMITNLSPNATYHYAIIEYSRSASPFNYNINNYTSGSFKMPNVYYNVGNEPLNKLSAWNTKRDASGVSPISFTDTFTYYLANYNPSPYIDSNWTVTGHKSFVAFGDNINALNYYIAPNTIVDIDSFRVRDNITLTVDGELFFRQGFFEGRCLTQFVSNNPQRIDTGTYQNVTITGGEKLLLGDVSVTQGLNMIGNINTNGNTLTMTGQLNHLEGFVIGRFKRNVYSNVEALFPLGIGAFYRPALVTPTNSGQITLTFADTTINNNGLPLFDATLSPLVRVNKAAKEGLWRIVNNTSTGSYKLVVLAEGFKGISDSSKLRLIKRNIGGTWTLQGTAIAVTGTNTAPAVGRTGLSGTGEFTIGSDSSINLLPVTLLHFTATPRTGYNYIKWNTATEINNKEFQLYRSFDKNTWEKIAVIEGAQQAANYQYNDYINRTQTVYYFLLQVDFNGETSPSEVVSVSPFGDKQHNFTVSPNPVTGNTLSINGQIDEPTEIKIFTPTGSLVKTLTVTDANELEQITIDELPKGVYVIHFSSSSQSHTQKFIKQ